MNVGAHRTEVGDGRPGQGTGQRAGGGWWLARPEGERRLLYGAGFTIVLLSRLTAAIRASALPFSVAPVSSVPA